MDYFHENWVTAGQHTRTREQVGGEKHKQIVYWNGGDRAPPSLSMDSWKEAQMMLVPKTTNGKKKLILKTSFILAKG